MTSEATVTVKLVKSPIGFTVRQKSTVRSLGFTKMNQTRTLPDNEAVRGMIGAVSHLVEVVQAGDEGKK